MERERECTQDAEERTQRGNCFKDNRSNRTSLEKFRRSNRVDDDDERYNDTLETSSFLSLSFSIGAATRSPFPLLALDLRIQTGIGWLRSLVLKSTLRPSS